MSGVALRGRRGELGVARALLDVDEHAGRREIDAAWKELLACVHPDMAGSERLRVRLDGLSKRVNHARDVLIADLELRANAATPARRTPRAAPARTNGTGTSLAARAGVALMPQRRPYSPDRTRFRELAAACVCIIVLAAVAAIATHNSSAGTGSPRPSAVRAHQVRLARSGPGPRVGAAIALPAAWAGLGLVATCGPGQPRRCVPGCAVGPYRRHQGPRGQLSRTVGADRGAICVF